MCSHQRLPRKEGGARFRPWGAPRVLGRTQPRPRALRRPHAMAGLGDAGRPPRGNAGAAAALEELARARREASIFWRGVPEEVLPERLAGKTEGA